LASRCAQRIDEAGYSHWGGFDLTFRFGAYPVASNKKLKVIVITLAPLWLDKAICRSGNMKQATNL